MNPPSEAKTTALYRPTIVGILYLLNVVLGFSVFVGLVLAYVWRAERETLEWEKTHYTYLIRTFWIGFVISLAMFALFFASLFDVVGMEEAGTYEPQPEAFVGAMFGWIAAWLLTAIWFVVRTVLSMVKAGNEQPMPNPKTWLF